MTTSTADDDGDGPPMLQPRLRTTIEIGTSRWSVHGSWE